MVEGALCLTVFLMMLFGILDFGRAVYGYNLVSAAAREGARYAMVRGATSGRTASAATVATYVRTWAIGIPTSDLTVNTTWSPDSQPGSTVNVNVQYNFKPLGPYMPAPFTVQSTSKMMISQ